MEHDGKLVSTWEMMPRYGYVYETTLPDGRRYIGQHQRNSKDKYYRGSGIIVSRFIKKYGNKNLGFKILTHADTQEILNILEIVWIKFMRPELNLAPGGMGNSGGSNNRRYVKTGSLYRCNNKSCENKVYRSACHITTRKHLYCSKDCQYFCIKKINDGMKEV